MFPKTASLALIAGLLLGADEPDPRAQWQRQVTTLNKQAEQAISKGDYAEGVRCHRQVVALQQKLHRRDKEPDGHPDLALALRYLGVTLCYKGDFDEAQRTLEQALAMYQKLDPEGRSQPNRAEQVEALLNLAYLFRIQNKHEPTVRYHKQAIEALRRLYPPDRNPNGHPLLASTLNNLGFVYHTHGDYEPAQHFYEEALAMNRKLYPAREYPRGHAELASTLTNLGALLATRGKPDAARRCFEEAVAMYRKLYPPSEYPRGHPQLASTLNLFASAFQQQGQTDEAQHHLEEALAIHRKLYPAGEYPQGHPALVRNLLSLADLLRDRAQFDAARRYYEEALSLQQKQPSEQLAIANTLSNIGHMLEALGRHEDARRRFEEALTLGSRLYPREQYPQGHPFLALCLNNLASAYFQQGRYHQAQRYLEQALAMNRKLYPPKQYPEGHAELAGNFSNLGLMLREQGKYEEALPYFEQAVAMYRKLYPPDRFPRGHFGLASALNNLGMVHVSRGDYRAAGRAFEQALAMKRKLFPPDEYPRGHYTVISTLNNLAATLETQGEYGRARRHYEEALALCRRLYPEAEYPQGHPELASTLINLAGLHWVRKNYRLAQQYFEEALAVSRKLYPEKDYPQGHPQLAKALDNLGLVLCDVKKYNQAQRYLEQALAMDRRLYPPSQYPQGHPDLATSLNNLGTLLGERGEFAAAANYMEEALAIYRKLYPADRFPHGHPILVRTLDNWGRMLLQQGKAAEALPLAEQAVTMAQQLFEDFAGGAAEAEALNFAANLPHAEELLLRASALTDAPRNTTYTHLWRLKGATARLLRQRGELLTESADAPTRQLAQQLVQARRALARALLSPTGDAVKGNLENLTRTKEDLERRLAERVPALARQQKLQHAGPEELARRLPAHTVFLDFFLYFHKQKGEDKLQPHYVAFVVWPDGDVRRVELGLAEPIDRAVTAWRKEIQERAARPGNTAAELRRLLWSPLAALVPADTEAVWLCPEGQLTALPWAALPGSRDDRVLLEDHAIAIVPYGPFLLEQLVGASESKSSDPNCLLVVGGVDYAEPTATASKKEGLWQALPGTERERREVEELAQKAANVEVLDRHGRAASTAQLVEDLPKARWAHLATHGFFADQTFRTALRLDETQFQRGSDRATAGARNPLVLSGLVLAGANRPESETDRGILSGETVAGLDLRHLQLAVLSACETGLGEQTAGEGIFGLQRAFHLAGTRNVMASLWQVDDDATAALMGLFYRNLWVEKLPPLEALRRAQLYLYRHPGDIRRLAGKRGLDFANPKEVPTGETRTTTPTTKQKAPVSQWAAFVLSGSGR